MKKYYIYKITNSINGKYYIGKRGHVNPEKDSYMGSGKLIKLAINKLGKENFKKEIIEVFETNKDACILEKKLVTNIQAKDPKCYNLHEGGSGGFAHINNLPKNKRPNFIKIAELKKSNKINWGGKTSGSFNSNSNSKSAKIASKLGNDKLKQLRKDGLIEYKHKGIKTTSTLGHHWYRNIKTGERSMFINKDIPIGWVTSKEYKELNRKSNKGWFNDGVKNFLIDKKSDKILNDCLIKGRIKTA